MRASTTGVAAGLLGSALVYAQPGPDFARAAELYSTAGAAMSDGRYADAERDFRAAYELTHDPVLFFKIGTATEKAGKCDVALVYYGRYLREANPAQTFVELTQQRIAACGGDPHTIVLGGSAGTGSAAVGKGSAATGSASAAEIPDVALAAVPPAPHAHGRDAAWLMVGGSLAFITVGAVLAYSASSSEQDLKDLYVGVGSTPPTYDDKTAKRYQDLVDEGHRYQYLSWASFGVAAGCAGVAAILFVVGDHHATVAPVVTPRETGVAATVRF